MTNKKNGVNIEIHADSIDALQDLILMGMAPTISKAVFIKMARQLTKSFGSGVEILDEEGFYESLWQKYQRQQEELDAMVDEFLRESEDENVDG